MTSHPFDVVISVGRSGESVRVRLRLGGDKSCEHCGARMMLEVGLHRSSYGYSTGLVADHTPTCREVVCPHGVRWDDGAETGTCALCTRADEERVAAIAAEQGDDE